MYNAIFYTYYQFRLLFRDESKKDAIKDRQDEIWACAFLTIIQELHILVILVGLSSLGYPHIITVKTRYMFALFAFFLFLSNLFYFYTHDKVKALVESQNQLSKEKKYRNIAWGIFLILLSVTAIAISLAIYFRIINNQEIKYEDN